MLYIFEIDIGMDIANSNKRYFCAACELLRTTSLNKNQQCQLVLDAAASTELEMYSRGWHDNRYHGNAVVLGFKVGGNTAEVNALSAAE